MGSMVTDRIREALDGCSARIRLLRALHRRDARRSRGAAARCRQGADADPWPDVIERMVGLHERRAAWHEREARFYDRLLRLPPFRSRRRVRRRRAAAANYIRWHLDWGR